MSEQKCAATMFISIFKANVSVNPNGNDIFQQRYLNGIELLFRFNLNCTDIPIQTDTHTHSIAGTEQNDRMHLTH